MFKLIDAETRRGLGLPLYTDFAAAKRVARDLGALVVAVRGR